MNLRRLFRLSVRFRVTSPYRDGVLNSPQL